MKNKLRKLTLAAALFGALATGSAHAGSYPVDASQFFAEQLKTLQQQVPFAAARQKSAAVARRKRPAVHKIGDVEKFWTTNFVTKENVQTSAVLKSIGSSCLIYVEQGKQVSDQALQKIRASFDDNVYPNARRYFGSEWKPGIDNDDRITLLLLDINDGYNGNGGYIAGYFYPVDQYLSSQLPAHLNNKSNEREMMYLDISPANPEKDDYMGIVAHEFQHMIHFHQDPEELLWVNEACSQIALYLCGFGHAPQVINYQWNPNNSLTAWSNYRMLANYGQVYLWNYYLASRFLKTDESRVRFFKELVASQKQGIKGYSEALEKISQRFTGVCHDFITANHLNDSAFGQPGQYSYDESLKDFRLPPAFTASSFPAKFESGVRLWGSEAISIDLTKAKSELNIAFSGFLGTFMYDYENEFTVELILKDSRGVNPTTRTSMSIHRKTQNGTLTIANDGRYDSALLIMFASFPVEVDDFQYANARPMAYTVQITDSGKEPQSPAHPADLVELTREFARLDAALNQLPADSQQLALARLTEVRTRLAAGFKTLLASRDPGRIENQLQQVRAAAPEKNALSALMKEFQAIVSFAREHSSTESTDQAAEAAYYDSLNSIITQENK